MEHYWTVGITLSHCFIFMCSIYFTGAQVCPTGYQEFNTNGVTRCYNGFDSALNYAEAEAICQNHRAEEAGFAPGRVAYPQSLAEHNNLKSILLNMRTKTKMWLGLRREQTTSNFWRFFSDEKAINDQGCFMYSNDRHGFYAPSGFDNSNLLPHLCVSKCKSQQKKYAALLDKQCLCGDNGHLFNTPYVTGLHGTPNSEGCFVGCPGDVMVKRCGAPGWIEIFLVDGIDAGMEWGLYQPNQYDSYQMCAALTSNKGFKYNDEDCSKKYHYICSLPVSGCTERVISGEGRVKLVEGNCLFFGWTERSWYDSLYDCKQRGGTLGKVLGAYPFEVLISILKNNQASIDISVSLTELWVDLTNRVWYLPNGADAQWFNWADREPDQRANDCMSMYDGTSYKWVDQDCTVTMPYVCQKDRDNCTPQSCQNGGTCMTRDNAFTCECTLGYEGNECQIEINPCNSSPCTNAVCTRVNYELYTCTCNAGYTGTVCETDINECTTLNVECSHGGVCEDKDNDYWCACTNGYSGRVCQFEIKECQSNPCRNGGSCEELVNGYNCHCVTGFSGGHCQTAPTTTSTTTTTTTSSASTALGMESSTRSSASTPTHVTVTTPTSSPTTSLTSTITRATPSTSLSTRTSTVLTSRDNSKTTTTKRSTASTSKSTASSRATQPTRSTRATTTSTANPVTTGLGAPTRAGASTGGTGTGLGTVEIVLIVVCCLLIILIVALIILVHHYKSKNNKRNKVYNAGEGGHHDGRGEANLPYSGAIGDDIFIPPGETTSVGSSGSRAGLLKLKNSDIPPRRAVTPSGDGGNSSRA